MNEQQLKEDLLKIETNHQEIWDITYKGHYVWPLLRIHLVDDLCRKYEQEINISAVNHPENWSVWRKVKVAFSYIVTPFRKKLNLPIVTSDILILGHSGHRSDSFENKYFSRILDSFSLLSKAFSSTFIEFDVMQDRFPKFGNVVELLPILEIVERRTNTALLQGDGIGENISHYDLFHSILKELGLPVTRTLQSMHRLLEIHNQLVPEAKEIVKSMNPRLLVTDMYYFFVGFAFIQACRELGVKSCDVQHGLQGELHYAYNYRLADNSKTPLLPDFFWSWTDVDSNRLNDVFKGTHIKAFCGGNPHLLHFLNTNTSLVLEASAQVRSILFPLGANKDHYLLMIEELIVPAIKALEDKIELVIRSHPEIPEFLEIVKNLFRKSGLSDNCTYRSAKDKNLYDELLACDICIVLGSSVAIDACLLGKTAIVISEEGEEYLGDYKDEGNMKFATSAAEIVEYVLGVSQVPTEKSVLKSNMNAKAKSALNLMLREVG